jgi:hypothetical protein
MTGEVSTAEAVNRAMEAAIASALKIDIPFVLGMDHPAMLLAAEHAGDMIDAIVSAARHNTMARTGKELPYEDGSAMVLEILVTLSEIAIATIGVEKLAREQEKERKANARP